MNAKLIRYDGTSLDAETAIQSLGASLCIFESTWIVKSDLACKEIYDRLKPILGPDVNLIVFALSRSFYASPETNAAIVSIVL